jgi:hypothetical protein
MKITLKIIMTKANKRFSLFLRVIIRHPQGKKADVATPDLVAVSAIRNLRLRHAVVTDPLIIDMRMRVGISNI